LENALPIRALGYNKKRDEDYLSSRPPLLKKGKSGVFEQYRKKGTLMVPLHQQLSGRMMGAVTFERKLFSIDYPPCVKYGQKHPKDYSIFLGRCFICRGEGHRWRNCQYLGQGYHYCGGRGHYKKECPNRNTGQV